MRKEQGFTLLEMLAVLMLMGVLFSLLAATLSGTRQSAAKVEQRQLQLSSQQSALALLRRSLHQALPIAVAGQTQPFQGNSSQLQFMAPMPSSLGGGLAHYRIDWHSSQLWLSLMAQQKSVDLAATSAKPLLQNVHQLQFAYLRAVPKGQFRWVAHWQSRSMPVAVRLRYQTADNAPRELVIALRPSIVGAGR